MTDRQTTDPFSLVGRTALVTGASRGIGAACARALDRTGARVALAARDRDALSGTAGTLGHDPVVLEVDLATDGGAERLAATALDRLGGRVDVLVNNAGIAVRKPSTELDASTIDQLQRVNVRALLLLCTGLIPAMVDAGRGSIVNVSSVSAVVGTPQRSAYAASKGAVDALTRSLAMEYGAAGVRVNSVAPGVIDTAMWSVAFSRPGVAEQVAGQTALRRNGTPEDVADVVAFLASDAARYVTGHTIPVDGGMSATVDIYAAPV
jgi:NAD(P)-dependent dehydrogenase (short-subunit alcohol dehydrogenase family)